ncbi:EamA family transporter [Zeaxanthinibacter enoshimensis]|uniref:Threonine/homoserine efflux transporter RhtA n=1 Tax=Zeaxanthinibacter enoshimensis TaxID=392009 RepID=A0A4V3D464_9FLAO|nr:DMT family transporter [Zeaxanthinibacter enoshimensis]TDQ33141.1 threonine/homoserine efflux transporter RhtA [Zeaxanthinibacter enoshimensis]
MRGILLIFIAACCYGVLSPIVKLAYGAGYTVSDVTGVQALIGMLFFWIVSLSQSAARKRSERKPLKVKKAVKLMLLGLPIGLTSMFYYQAVEFIPASLGILLLFQFTWIGILAEAIANREFPSGIKLIALVLLLGGTALVAGVRPESFNFWGTIYGFLAAISYSAFIWINGRVATDVPAVPKSKWMMTGATLLIFAVYTPEFLWDGALTDGLLYYGVPLALFGTIIPPLFFALGVPLIGVGLTSILSAVELPVAVLFSMLLLSEPVSAWQWVGVCIILTGVLLPNRNVLAEARV